MADPIDAAKPAPEPKALLTKLAGEAITRCLRASGLLTSSQRIEVRELFLVEEPQVTNRGGPIAIH